MKKLIIIFLLMPFLGIAQSTNFAKNLTTSTIRTNNLKNNANLWTFQYLTGTNALNIITTDGVFSIPTDATSVTTAKTFTINVGTGLSLTSGTATQTLAGNPLWGIGLSSAQTFASLNLSGTTASTIASFDASKNLVALSTSTYPSLTELSYVKGATSNLQTQLNSISSTYLPISNPVATTLLKVNSGVNNVEISPSQLMFRRTNGTTMNIANYNAYSHDFYTASSYSGLVQAMSITSDAQVNIGNQVLSAATDPDTQLKVGATNDAKQKIVSTSAGATLELNGATGGIISNVTGNINYNSAGSHVFNSTVSLPYTTSIGSVSATELSYVDGVTSSIQTQFAGKLSTSSLGTGVATFLATPSSANLLAALTTKTGTGNAVFDTSPTISNPTISGVMNVGTGTNAAKFHVFMTSGAGQVMLGYGAGQTDSYFDQQNVYFRSRTGTTQFQVQEGNVYSYSPFTIGNTTIGRIRYSVGSASQIAYQEFLQANGTRVGYIGYDNTNMSYVAENGAKHVFSGSNLKFDATTTATGTTGNQTINKTSGCVNMAAGTSSITVTNSLVTSSNIIQATIQTDDATAILKNVVPTSGSFVIKTTANVTAETKVCFIVYN